MTKLLHPLPPSFAILAHAVASLEEQYLAINSIDTDKHPDLIKSRKDTLKYLDFEFEAINADIEFINLQTTNEITTIIITFSIPYKYQYPLMYSCIIIMTLIHFY